MALLTLIRTKFLFDIDRIFESSIEVMGEVDKELETSYNLERVTDTTCTVYCDLLSRKEVVEASCLAFKS